MVVHQIDIYPDATLEDGIKRSDNDEYDPEYRYYRYTGSSSSFNLSALLYNGKLLPGIPPYIITIENIVTYFKGDKILLIQILASGIGSLYRLNQDVDEDVDKVTFAEFTPRNAHILHDKELGAVLKNITEHGGFNFPELYKRNRSTALQIVGYLDLVFDLERVSLGSNPTIYPSEISKRKIVIKEDKILNGSFKKASHTLVHESFQIKGIKLPNGEYMKVKGGLPTGVFEEFNVYYRDADHTNPLLVELLEFHANDEHVQIAWHLTKNANGKWDLRKICSVIDEATELVQVLQNIVTHNRLLVDKISDESLRTKLGDIRDGLSVDVTQIRGSTGVIQYYSFDGVSIPYKKCKDAVQGYFLVRHATIPHFTLKKIKVAETKELTKDELPPFGTLFGRLNAYYIDYASNNPVLIELECLDHSALEDSPNLVYYYSRNDGDRWMGYRLEIKAYVENNRLKFPDKDALISHIKENGNKIVFEDLKGKLTGKLTKYPSQMNNKREQEDVVKEADEKAEERTSTGSMQNSKHNIQSGESGTIEYGVGVTFGILAICVGIYLLFPSIKRLAHDYSIQKLMYRRYV
ncbi:hypothetical protein BEWA_045410 [Theileria equi strain WA]|uniref:Uncharacterized protein n=1 Tax=Theileria equi strain WA TaxID=1537102 RepID=L1L9I5_THEEQ|nr:hypothetical protein BEWA_045410 [Theileria equi strain WA]EKX72077.1 hypothetical protein BEWA_045410 [Theileria equi strain WA]|eukprot:XP_004831529.1 hypothetical protein BEWA_045410 [Theileria equi strain WA]